LGGAWRRFRRRGRVPSIRSRVELSMRRQFWPRLGPLRPLSRTYPGRGLSCGRPDPITLIRHLNQLLQLGPTGELLLFGAAGAVPLALAPVSLIPLPSQLFLLRTPANYSYSFEGRRALCGPCPKGLRFCRKNTLWRQDLPPPPRTQKNCSYYVGIDLLYV
jgi:hypothetical protein